MVCWITSRLNVAVPWDVQSSPEWERRVTRNLKVPVLSFTTDWRHPRHWSWRQALADRAKRLARGHPVPLEVEANVARLPTSGEVRWAELFYYRSKDEAWCLSLGQFDARCLDGLPPLALDALPSPAMQDRRVSSNIRRWRHRLQGLFLEWMTEADCLTERSFRTGDYIPVPEGWYRFEVPYGLRVDMPTVLRCWGLEMARSPYREQETAWRRGPLAHCLWAVFFAQWVRNVAHAIMTEVHLPGPNARLWWLPPALVAAMRRIGCTSLLGGDVESGRRLEALLAAIETIHWSKVDPARTIWPLRNDVGAPIYRNGDFVPWDVRSWAAAVPIDMLGGGYAALRGEIYTGALGAFRDEHSGRVTRPRSWEGHGFDDLRGLARADRMAAEAAYTAGSVSETVGSECCAKRGGAEGSSRERWRGKAC